MASQYAMLNGGECAQARAEIPRRTDADPFSFPRFSPFRWIPLLHLPSVALLAISQHSIHRKRLAVPLIIAGTTLFSGSIFALLLFKGKMGSLTKIVGPSTPAGGLLMIGGYLSLVSLSLA